MDQIDTTDTTVITVNVNVSLQTLDEQRDPRAARQWLADRIRDLTGVPVSGHQDHEHKHEGPAGEFEVTAITIPRD
jgi:hypothetical protein